MTVFIPEHVRTGGLVPTPDLMWPINDALANLPKIKVPSSPLELPRRAKDSGDPDVGAVVAVNDHLIPVSSDLTSDEQDMLSTSVLWIQHVLQGYCTGDPNKGYLGWTLEKFSDPDTRNTTVFYDAVISVLAKYCGWIALVGNYNTSYTDQTKKGEIDISAVVKTVLAAVAAPGTAEMLAVGAAALASKEQDTGVSNVGNFFWNSKYHKDEKCQFTVTPALKNENNFVEYAYLLTYESIIQDDWRTLFVQSHYEEFTFSACSAQIRLALPQWNAKVDPNVVKDIPEPRPTTVGEYVKYRLGEFVSTQIQTAPI
ncbi:hypothetical protein B0G81_7814 [Paraburkholderia sp. BL6665CI2N2]|uniref:hypothetical protein n=1 Tax=Paraburkholderia sp. BL6665CI2N2 TaxID=1938806 RepID=UPI00106625FD|nr:hypothetical protein [Paraburkholderia sp. BL6665CI2N2]TDY16721.1 hypothetical protein B0G81_7814 [Paraburkholderia sp. BL6665CI2N2]